MSEPGGPTLEAVLGELGVAEVGRLYIEALTERLAAVRDSVDRPSPSPTEKIIVDAVLWGEDDEGKAIPDDLRWELLLATLRACPPEDGLLWCLGDGPFDIFAERPGAVRRIYEERESSSDLQRLFEAMRRTLPSEGVTGGWWFE